MVLTQEFLQSLTPNEEYKGITVETKDPWPSVSSTRPFNFGDVKKALSLTIVNSAPAMTAVMASSVVAGSVVSGGNPLAGMLISKTIPLGYAAYKVADLSLMKNRDFWENLKELESSVVDKRGFWQGVGKSYAYGTADKYSSIEEESIGEGIGRVAGTLMRDFVSSAGLGRLIGNAKFIRDAATRGISAAEASGSSLNVSKAIDSAKSIDKLLNGLAFSSSMGTNASIERYNLEVGMGSNELDALYSALSSGAASGASGVAFLSIAPFAITKYANRLNETWSRRMFMSSVEWSGWAGLQEQTNNMIRTKAFDMEPEETTPINDLAKIAAVGAAFSVGGSILGAMLSKSSGRINSYILDKASRKQAAKDLNKLAEEINIERDISNLASEMSNEVASVNGFKTVDESISNINDSAESIIKKNADSVSIARDDGGYILNPTQIRWAVDNIRALINDGIEYNEAVEQIWKKYPPILRTVKAKEQLLRTLEIGK